MSLLVDLLSKTKTKESRKDIPPDLRRAVTEGSFQQKTRRKVIILSVLVLIIFLAGFAAIYVMEAFKSSLTKTVATKTDSGRLLPPPGIRDEKPLKPPEAEVSEKVATVMPKAIAPDANSQRKVRADREIISRAAINISGDRESAVPQGMKNQAQGTGRSSAGEGQGTEKPQQKTQKDVYLYAARTHEAKNEFKQALEYYLKALESDPANYVVMNNIAGVWIRLQSYGEAMSYAKKALDVKAHYVPSLINAGIASVSLGNFSEGEGFLARAAAIEPSNRVALFNLAVLSEKQGNYDRAYENYYKLSQMRDVDGCLGAARILEKQGQNTNAARFYREILSIESASPSIKQFANQKLSQLAR